jgi:hypothetical protein
MREKPEPNSISHSRWNTLSSYLLILSFEVLVNNPQACPAPWDTYYPEITQQTIYNADIDTGVIQKVKIQKQ